jgi:hypothetical protein
MIHEVKREKHVVNVFRADRIDLKEGDILIISKYKGRVKEKYIVTSDNSSCGRCSLLSTSLKCEYYPINCHGRALLKIDDILESL